MRFLPFTDVTVCAHEDLLESARRFAEDQGHDVTITLVPTPDRHVVDFGADLVDMRVAANTQAEVDLFVADWDGQI